MDGSTGMTDGQGRPYTLRFVQPISVMELYDVFGVFEHGNNAGSYVGSARLRREDGLWEVAYDGRIHKRLFDTREEAGNWMVNKEFDYDEREFLPNRMSDPGMVIKEGGRRPRLGGEKRTVTRGSSFGPVAVIAVLPAIAALLFVLARVL